LRTEKIVSGSTAEVPPPGAGVATEIDAQPKLARSAGRTTAVRVVLLLKVVESGEPFRRTVELLLKPVPVTVRLVAVEPEAIACGLIDVRVGDAENPPPVMVWVELA
jgi:hypothetical protein